jgi:hypothetical protein
MLHEPRHHEATLRELVANAVRFAPVIVPLIRWSIDDVALVLAEGDPSDDAWVQLGSTLEAIAVTVAPEGAVIVPGAISDPRRVLLHVSDAPVARSSDRLAACVLRPSGAFRAPAQRVAAHVPARLAAAAALHGSTLHWIDSPPALVECAELVAAVGSHPGVPPGACALCVTQAARSDVEALVQAGRAACRVWLEAISLGLAVLSVDPISWRTFEGRPEAIAMMRRYRALLPATDEAFASAMFWLGLAA